MCTGRGRGSMAEGLAEVAHWPSWLRCAESGGFEVWMAGWDSLAGGLGAVALVAPLFEDWKIRG